MDIKNYVNYFKKYVHTTAKIDASKSTDVIKASVYFNRILHRSGVRDMQPSINQVIRLYTLVFTNGYRIRLSDFIGFCGDELYKHYSSSIPGISINTENFWTIHDDGIRVQMLYNEICQYFETREHVSVRLMDGHGRIIVPLLMLITEYLKKNPDKFFTLEIFDVESRVNIWHKILFEYFIVYDHEITNRLYINIPTTRIPTGYNKSNDIFNPDGDVFKNNSDNHIIYMNFCGIDVISSLQILRLIYLLGNEQMGGTTNDTNTDLLSISPTYLYGDGTKNDVLLSLSKAHKIFDFDLKSSYSSSDLEIEPIYLYEYDAHRKNNVLLCSCRAQVKDFIKNPVMLHNTKTTQTGGGSVSQTFFLSGLNAFPQKRVFMNILLTTQERISCRDSFYTFKLNGILKSQPFYLMPILYGANNTSDNVIDSRYDAEIGGRFIIYTCGNEMEMFHASNTKYLILLALMYNHILQTGNLAIDEINDLYNNVFENEKKYFKSLNVNLENEEQMPFEAFHSLFNDCCYTHYSRTKSEVFKKKYEIFKEKYEKYCKKNKISSHTEYKLLSMLSYDVLKSKHVESNEMDIESKDDIEVEID